MRSLSISALLFGGMFALSFAADPKESKKETPYEPVVKPASGEGEAAIKRFQFDKSLKVELWAAEPMLANPVAFCFDEKGRCYVAETFRHSAGVTDNRSKPWLEDELASRTVADRVAVYKKYSKNFENEYEKERDRVRLIEDTTGSGKADKATVFRDDFGKAEDGIGSGLLARHGDVYFTCIPSLYKLKDTKGTGSADVKEILSTGYGVHVAFIGHDLHGLRIGPDGRLYFTVGDRGLNVKTKEGKHLFNPDSGAVLRCEVDGSNLEIVHIGLRNPQELAFDDYGNLFTVDNNSDSGDKARFVYIVEGGDSGWRIGYQYGSSMHDSSVKQGNRGPWNYEKLWHPQHEGQPAYILPPLANFADGPSGFTHYPGVGLNDKYKGHFFLCDFRGNSGGSGVWSFTTKPKGASFELVNPQHFVWNVLATDCDFGPDSAFYISDWTEGWSKPGKGRIYKVSDLEAQKSDAVIEAKKLLAEGFSKRSVAELTKLLEHPHQQVRMEAQFALAAKGKDAIEPFAKVAKESKNQFAKLHTIWGMTQLLRKDLAERDNIYKCLLELSFDPDDEVRAQAANSMRVHWIRFSTATKNNGNWVPVPDRALLRLLELLEDSNPRVRYFAAMSLGSIEHYMSHGKFDEIKSIKAILGFIRDAEKDPYLRHAGARALGFHPPPRPDRSHSSALKMSDILLDRMYLTNQPQSSEDKQSATSFGEYILDKDPRIVNEAARAIHDLGVKRDYQILAELTAKSDAPIEALYRALNTNFRMGQSKNAAALATFAARADAPANLRVLALQMLGSWPKPPRRDYITGLTQSLPDRDASVAADAFKAKLAGIFAGPAAVQKEAATVAAKLGITEVGPFLLTLVTDAKALAATRIEAINALDALKDKRLQEAVDSAIASNDPRLRNAGRAVLLKSKPDEVLKQLKEVLAKNDAVEKQGAIVLLSDIKSGEAEKLLEAWLDKLLKNETLPELQLDILEAAGKRNTPALQQRLKTYRDTRPQGDELASVRETLFGGDAARGRDIFLNKAAVSCQRCHKLDGEGGEVGPPINGIAAKQKRDYLLESLVLPNKQIAKGYDSILITDANGKTVSGVLKSEDAKEVKLMTAEGQLLTIKKDDIDERRTTKTAMPEDLNQKLTKSEIRDLVEFLAGLKEEWKK